MRSNLTSILGRTAAYRGREVTWNDMISRMRTAQSGPVRIEELASCEESANAAPARLRSVAFQFVQVARPVVLEQCAEGAISEDAALGLAAGAVVGLVVGIADPLHGCSTRGKDCHSGHGRPSGGGKR